MAAEANRWNFIMSKMRRHFVSGLLVWIPLIVTILIIKFVLDLLDHTFLLLPTSYQPDNLLGRHIPGLTAILAVAIVLLTGMVAANFVGKHLVTFWESLLARIPLVRSIYSGVKKVMQTVFSPTGQAFRKVLLVEYPRAGLWSIAFQTGNGFIEAQQVLDAELVTIFIPTTPNPTSGFLMFVPKKDVIELNMSVETGLKLVISLGVVLPEATKNKLVEESTLGQ